MVPRKQAGHMTCTRPQAERQILLAMRASSTHDPTEILRRASMLDHVIVTVSDFTRSIAFYEQALKPLGITDFLAYEGQDGHPDLKASEKTDASFSGSKREGLIRTPFTSVLSPKVTLR
jgi:hypothetical protein